MTTDYPHIPKSLDTITPISADPGWVREAFVLATELPVCAAQDTGPARV